MTAESMTWLLSSKCRRFLFDQVSFLPPFLHKIIITLFSVWMFTGQELVYVRV